MSTSEVGSFIHGGEDHRDHFRGLQLFLWDRQHAVSSVRLGYKVAWSQDHSCLSLYLGIVFSCLKLLHDKGLAGDRQVSGKQNGVAS